MKEDRNEYRSFTCAGRRVTVRTEPKGTKIVRAVCAIVVLVLLSYATR